MTHGVHLTRRDLVVLRALSYAVRLFGQRQLATALWNSEIANARRRLRRLDELGLIERKTALVRPTPELLCPVFQWKPGQTGPGVGQVAFRLQSRWRYQSLRSTVVILPTQKTIDHFGGRQKSMLSSQVSHDLGVSEVWLWYLHNHGDVVRCWRGEDMLDEYQSGDSLPDAVLVDANEQPHTWIEFGGDYNADRIARFHEDAAQLQMPYQIW